MPHSGPRSSPLTDFRHACPASTTATAAVDPNGTTTVAPLTVTVTSLNMRVFLRSPRGKVRLNGNSRSRPRDLVGEDARGSKRCRNSQTFVPGRQKYGLVPGPRPDQRKLVGSCGTKSRPCAQGRHLTQPWHIFLRALQHTHEHEVIHFVMLCTVLARRPDKNLASAARLHVERDRVTADRVNTLQIAEFHQLVPQKSGIPVGDNQMSLSLFDLEPRSKIGGGRSGGIHNDAGRDLRTVR